MSYNSFHRTYGFPKDITYHGMRHYTLVAIENTKCGCCSNGCKCSKDNDDKEEDKVVDTKPEEQATNGDTCTDKPLENYIDNTSIDDPSDFKKTCDNDAKVQVNERDKDEELCTNECLPHDTLKPHTDDIMKKFKNLDGDDPCPLIKPQ